MKIFKNDESVIFKPFYRVKATLKGLETYGIPSISSVEYKKSEIKAWKNDFGLFQSRQKVILSANWAKIAILKVVPHQKR